MATLFIFIVNHVLLTPLIIVNNNSYFNIKNSLLEYFKSGLPGLNKKDNYIRCKLKT